ncbi:MAG: GNAT family N-acetyltransferase [Sulfitobacter sp.]
MKYAQNIFRYDSIVFGACVGGILRGLGELRGVFHSWPCATEAAFSVELDWQNLGVGDALFEEVFAMAQDRRVGTIQMTCLKENNRMQHLAVKHHAQLVLDQVAVEAVLHPTWPLPKSIAKEIIGEPKGASHQRFG